MQTEIIYIDSLNHCHRTNDGAMTAVETEFFVGKCDAFVEGYVIDDSKGYRQIYPWKPYSELALTQQLYEYQLIADYESALSEIETALGV